MNRLDLWIENMKMRADFDDQLIQCFKQCFKMALIQQIHTVANISHNMSNDDDAFIFDWISKQATLLGLDVGKLLSNIAEYRTSAGIWHKGCKVGVCQPQRVCDCKLRFGKEILLFSSTASTFLGNLHYTLWRDYVPPKGSFNIWAFYAMTIIGQFASNILKRPMRSDFCIQ